MTTNNQDIVAQIAALRAEQEMLKQIAALKEEQAKLLAHVEEEQVQVATPAPAGIDSDKFCQCAKNKMVVASLSEMTKICKAYKRALPTSGQTLEICGETFLITRKGGGMLPLSFECLKLSTKKFDEVFGHAKKMTTVADKRKIEKRRETMLTNALAAKLSSM